MKRVLFFLGQLNDIDVEWMIKNGSKIELKTISFLITEAPESGLIKPQI